MEKRNIGKSGLSAPFLGLGTWAIGGGSWWGDNDDALSVKAIETAVEQGITWIDTAPIYGLYHSEEVVGEALRHIDRDKVILSTKCGLEWRHESPILHKVVDGVQTYRDLSAKSIIEDVEDSLRRLGTDHLDVLYTHWQTPDLNIFPLEETVEAMMKLKEQGKIRAIGASNTTAEFIRGYCKYGQLDVIQEKYSLLTRMPVKGGGHVWVQLHGVITKNKYKGYPIAYSVLVDVDDTVKMQQAQSITYNNIPGFVAKFLIRDYLHIRLLDANKQFVEFFGKFYEGGGRAFHPFAPDTKYVDVKEES